MELDGVNFAFLLFQGQSTKVYFSSQIASDAGYAAAWYDL